MLTTALLLGLVCFPAAADFSACSDDETYQTASNADEVKSAISSAADGECVRLTATIMMSPSQLSGAESFAFGDRSKVSRRGYGYCARWFRRRPP